MTTSKTPKGSVPAEGSKPVKPATATPKPPVPKTQCRCAKNCCHK